MSTKTNNRKTSIATLYPENSLMANDRSLGEIRLNEDGEEETTKEESEVKV